MNANEHDLIQEKSKDPRVLEVFNALRANPKNTLIEALFDVAVFAVENNDFHEMLTKAKEQIDVLELKLAALSGNKPNDVLKAVFNESDLKSRVKEMDASIKGLYPALTSDEAINGWAMMTIRLRDAVDLLTEARSSQAELATQLAAAQRGILAAHVVPTVIANNDPSFQFSATNPRIKFLAEEFAKIPRLTLDMAVDRWATFSLCVAELRLELERYKEDSKKKRFAANVNADVAIDLHDQKVVRYKTESKRGKKGVDGKKNKTQEIKDLVFKWCADNRSKHPYSNHFAINIAEWYLVKEPVMKARKAGTLAGYVKKWEKENDFQRG